MADAQSPEAQANACRDASDPVTKWTTCRYACDAEEWLVSAPGEDAHPAVETSVPRGAQVRLNDCSAELQAELARAASVSGARVYTTAKRGTNMRVPRDGVVLVSGKFVRTYRHPLRVVADVAAAEDDPRHLLHAMNLLGEFHDLEKGLLLASQRVNRKYTPWQLSHLRSLSGASSQKLVGTEKAFVRINNGPLGTRWRRLRPRDRVNDADLIDIDGDARYHDFKERLRDLRTNHTKTCDPTLVFAQDVNALTEEENQVMAGRKYPRWRSNNETYIVRCVQTSRRMVIANSEHMKAKKLFAGRDYREGA